MGNRPITSNKWKSYTVIGTIDSKSDDLNFGAICSYNGKFYFDKFELYIEDDNGEFQPIEINNSSFEDKTIDNVIPNWSQGISKGEPYRVKEFTFSSNNDSVDGNYSLLIEGDNITGKTGFQQETFPNIGLWICLIYFLIIAFSLLTFFSPISEDKKSKLGLIGFRFSFIYFILFILFQNNGAYHFWDEYIIKPNEGLLHKFIPWVGKHVLQLSYDITTFTNGSGDTTYDYVIVFVIFFIAVLGTIAWSIIDRKSRDYSKLFYWLTTGMRYYVGLMLIQYGLSKVIPLQFPEPGFYKLMQTFGESSPMGLAWTFLGFSEGYNIFMGIAEILAGLLLFRRTLALGAIITLMTTMNVMAVNYFFDVPVKIISTHLVLITLFLLLKDIKKVMRFLITNTTVEKLTVIRRPHFKKWIDVSFKLIKGLLITYALGYGFYKALEIREEYTGIYYDITKSELYGVYKVKNYVINNDTITNYKNDKLWRTIMFEREGFVEIETMNGKMISYKVETDSITKKMKFSSSGGELDAFDFNYTKTDTSLDFNFIFQNDTVSGQTRIMNDDKLLLINRGFNWINEYPYNR